MKTVIDYYGDPAGAIELLRVWSERASVQLRPAGSKERLLQGNGNPDTAKPFILELTRDEWLRWHASPLLMNPSPVGSLVAKGWRTAELVDAIARGWLHVIAQPFTPSTWVSNLKWQLEPGRHPDRSAGTLQIGYASMAQLEMTMCVGESNRGLEFMAGHWVEQYLRGRVKGMHIRHLRLATSELLTNAIEWGNRNRPGSQVRFSVSLDSSHVVIRMMDEGGGFDYLKALNDDRDPTVRMRERLASGKRPGGFGLTLVKRLMDTVNVMEGGRIVLAALHV